MSLVQAKYYRKAGIVYGFLFIISCSFIRDDRMLADFPHWKTTNHKSQTINRSHYRWGMLFVVKARKFPYGRPAIIKEQFMQFQCFNICVKHFAVSRI